MSTKTHHFETIDKLVEGNMSDMSVSPHSGLYIKPSTASKKKGGEGKKNVLYHEEGLIVKTKALDKKTETMFEIIEEVLSSTLFDDHQRLKSLMLQMVSDIQEEIIYSAHRYASLVAKSNLSSYFVCLSLSFLLFPSLSLSFPSLSFSFLLFPFLSLSFPLFPSLSLSFLLFPSLSFSFLLFPSLWIDSCFLTMRWKENEGSVAWCFTAQNPSKQ